MPCGLCHCSCVISIKSLKMSASQSPHHSIHRRWAVLELLTWALSGHQLRATPGDFPFVKRRKRNQVPSDGNIFRLYCFTQAFDQLKCRLWSRAVTWVSKKGVAWEGSVAWRLGSDSAHGHSRRWTTLWQFWLKGLNGLCSFCFRNYRILCCPSYLDLS